MNKNFKILGAVMLGFMSFSCNLITITILQSIEYLFK